MESAFRILQSFLLEILLFMKDMAWVFTGALRRLRLTGWSRDYIKIEYQGGQ